MTRRERAAFADRTHLVRDRSRRDHRAQEVRVQRVQTASRRRVPSRGDDRLRDHETTEEHRAEPRRRVADPSASGITVRTDRQELQRLRDHSVDVEGFVCSTHRTASLGRARPNLGRVGRNERSLVRNRDFVHLWSGGDDLAARQPGQPDRASAPRNHCVARHDVRGRRADCRRVLAVRVVRAAGGRDRRPAPPPTRSDRCRHRACDRACVDPGRVRVRRADLRASCSSSSSSPGTLTVFFDVAYHVDPPVARRARPARRRERQARDQPVGRAARGPGARRPSRARPSGRRARSPPTR